MRERDQIQGKAQAAVDLLDDILRSDVSRRAFLTRMGTAGLGAAAVALLAGCGSGSRSVSVASGLPDPANFPGIPGRNENEAVLNYALTLEILEADLYRQALNLASGRDSSAPLDATAPSSPTSTGSYSLVSSFSTGGLSASAAQLGFLYLAQYAYVEAAHRDFLTVAIQSLGGTPVSRNPKGYTFPLGSDLASVLGLIYAVEETGVRAYLGAARFLSVDALQNLTPIAVAIHSTEARHSAALAYVLGKDTGPVANLPGVTPPHLYAAGPHENTFQYYSDPTEVLSAVQAFIVK